MSGVNDQGLNYYAMDEQSREEAAREAESQRSYATVERVTFPRVLKRVGIFTAIIGTIAGLVYLDDVYGHQVGLILSYIGIGAICFVVACAVLILLISVFLMIKDH